MNFNVIKNKKNQDLVKVDTSFLKIFYLFRYKAVFKKNLNLYKNFEKMGISQQLLTLLNVQKNFYLIGLSPLNIHQFRFVASTKKEINYSMKKMPLRPYPLLKIMLEIFKNQLNFKNKKSPKPSFLLKKFYVLLKTLHHDPYIFIMKAIVSVFKKVWTYKLTHTKVYLLKLHTNLIYQILVDIVKNSVNRFLENKARESLIKILYNEFWSIKQGKSSLLLKKYTPRNMSRYILNNYYGSLLRENRKKDLGFRLFTKNSKESLREKKQSKKRKLWLSKNAKKKYYITHKPKTKAKKKHDKKKKNSKTVNINTRIKKSYKKRLPLNQNLK